MATTMRDTGSEQRSGLDQLRDAVLDYLGAQVDNLADKAGDKLGDVTRELVGAAESGGVLPNVGLRILRGDSPLKAFIGETTKSMFGKITDALGIGGGAGQKSGGTKFMNIIEVLDVGRPRRFAYDHWTQYEEFSSFTKGVRSVSRKEDTESDWKVKVGPSTRSWKATVQEQVPDERIVWTSKGAKGTTRGCVSFHELAPTLTRIVLTVEYYPSGFFEKTGNIWRVQGRRLRLDFKHFQRYVTFTEEEPEGWRGEIREGEVVRTHEEAVEEEKQAAEDGEGTPKDDASVDGQYAPQDEDTEDGRPGQDEDDDEESEEEEKSGPRSLRRTRST